MMKLFSFAVFATAIVTALALVGLGAYMGSTFITVLGMGGVPILLVLALVLHYVHEAQRSGELDRAQRRQFERTLERIAHTLQDAHALSLRAGVPPGEIASVVERARRVLDPHVRVHEEGERLVVVPAGALPPGSWLHRAETGVRQVLADAGPRVATLLETRLDSLDDGAKKPLPSDSLQAACRAYLDRVGVSRDRIAQQVDTVEQAIADLESQGFDVAEAWGHVRSSKRFWEEGQVDLAVRTLKDAEAIVLSHIGPAFDERRQGLLDSIAAVRRLELLAITAPQTVESVAKLEKDVKRLDARDGGLTALEQAEQRFAGLLQDLTKDAMARIARAKETVAAYPGVADAEGLADLEETVRSAPRPQHPYQETFPAWLDVMRIALERVQRLNQEATLMRYYPRLEQVIKQRLASDRRVVAADLPVRERAEDILAIYARLHASEVTFAGGVLEVKGGGVSG